MYLPQDLVGGNTTIVNGLHLLRINDKEFEDTGRIQRAFAIAQFHIVPACA